MSWDFTNDPEGANAWIEALVSLDPIAPGPGPQAWEQDDLLDLVSALLPHAHTGLECIGLAEAIDRAGKAGEAEGARLLEEILVLAYARGSDESVEQEWEVEWWLETVHDLCPGAEARSRVRARLGLGAEL